MRSYKIGEVLICKQTGLKYTVKSIEDLYICTDQDGNKHKLTAKELEYCLTKVGNRGDCYKCKYCIDLRERDRFKEGFYCTLKTFFGEIPITCRHYKEENYV